MNAGYSTEMKEESVRDFEYPNGKIWKDLFQSGKYHDPSLAHKRLWIIKMILDEFVVLYSVYPNGIIKTL